MIATGARYRMLDIPGEKDLLGINIHFCATCDGAFYKDKDVMVIGSGNSAFEESLFLTKFATHIAILARDEKIKASKILQEKVMAEKKIDVYTGYEAIEFNVSDNRLAGVKAKNLITGEISEWSPDGVFVFIGMTPNSNFLPAEVNLDRRGFIITDATLQTSQKGVFAAGDVRAGATAQAASAAGEGATTAIMIRHYLQSIHEE